MASVFGLAFSGVQLVGDLATEIGFEEFLALAAMLFKCLPMTLRQPQVEVVSGLAFHRSVVAAL